MAILLRLFQYQKVRTKLYQLIQKKKDQNSSLKSKVFVVAVAATAIAVYIFRDDLFKLFNLTEIKLIEIIPAQKVREFYKILPNGSFTRIDVMSKPIYDFDDNPPKIEFITPLFVDVHLPPSSGGEK